jgi:hypothetical protein
MDNVLLYGLLLGSLMTALLIGTFVAYLIKPFEGILNELFIGNDAATGSSNT